MDGSPVFFIPDVVDEDVEEIYATLASTCYRSALPVGRRIYSIAFRHDGVDWIARVGHSLRGTEIVTKGRGSKRREYVRPRSDPAIVTAIFPGNPYIVWTDGTRSAWVNPFFAGTPTSVTLFSTSEEANTPPQSSRA